MKNISIKDFQEVVESGQDINVVDVRPRELYEAGHIPGAKHIPLSTVEDNLDQFNKNEHYYMICHDGKGSAKATEILTKEGFDVTNVEEGVPAYGGDLE